MEYKTINQIVNKYKEIRNRIEDNNNSTQKNKDNEREDIENNITNSGSNQCPILSREKTDKIENKNTNSTNKNNSSISIQCAKSSREFIKLEITINQCIRNPIVLIDSLEKLIKEIYKVYDGTSSVDVDYVQNLMKCYSSRSEDWKKYAKFDDKKYTRHLIDEGNGRFNFIILCWANGQTSSIHDHSNSHCFMKMLEGSLTETRYQMPQNSNKFKQDQNLQPLQKMNENQLNLNDVCYINDSIGLHKVGNEGPHQYSVSLHLYSPPFDMCSSFNEQTGQQTKCAVTFTSKFGEFV